MSITLDPKLEAVLTDLARQRGVPLETFVLTALRERFLPPSDEPRDEWERRPRDIAIDCGVSPPPEAITSEDLYD